MDSSKNAVNDFGRAIELVIGAAVAALLTFAALVWVARVTGPAEYADFSAALVVVYFAMYAISTLVAAVARVSSRLVVTDSAAAVGALRRELFRIVLRIAPAIVIVAALCAVPLARALRFHSATPLFLAVVTVALYGFLNIDRGIAQGLFLVRQYNLNLVVEAGTRALLIFAVLRAMPTATMAMAVWVAAVIVAQIMIAPPIRRVCGKGTEQRASLGELAGMLRPITFLLLSIGVFQNADLIAVKRWFSPADAGAYAAASALARGFGIVFVPLFALAGPLLTREHADGRSVRRPTLRLAGGYVALTIAPLFVVALWPETIVRVLYGPDYARAATILLPLAGVTILTYAGFMLAQALITVGDYRFVRFYVALVFAQIVALILFHRSFREVLIALYAVQGTAFIAVAVFFAAAESLNDTSALLD